jgi:hypothetical protein
MTDINAIHHWAEATVIQDDGRIVACGSASNGSNYDFAIVRYK